MQVHHYGRNPAGRDLIVGDIHGHFTKLQAALDAVGFDPSRDRLFSVGDLVDRGPESEHALAWLDKPWFKSVRGNHEQIVADVARGIMPSSWHVQNAGGGWFAGQPRDWQMRVALTFEALPICIELETAAGMVGIVHGDCPADSWDTLKDRLANDPQAYEAMCMWNRDRFDHAYRGNVDGVVAVVVGHTPMERWTSLGNVLYIDTGAWLPAHRGPRDFTLLDAATLQPLPLPKRGLAWS